MKAAKFTSPRVIIPLLVMITCKWFQSGGKSVDASATRTIPLQISRKHYLDNSGNYTDSLSTVRLKRCDGNEEQEDIIYIPTQEIDQFGNISYTLKPFRFDKDDAPLSCGNWYSPSATITTTIPSISNFTNYLTSNLPKRVQFLTPLLLSNGYLSIGKGESVQYFSSEEYCVQSTSGRDQDLTVTLKTCDVTPDRPILTKCCPMGTARIKNGDCLSITDDHNWHPDYVDPAGFAPTTHPNPVYYYKELSCTNKEAWEENDCDTEFHPLANNMVIYVSSRRTLEQLHPQVEHCFDRIIQTDGSVKRALLVCSAEADLNKSNKPHSYLHLYPISMYIGAVFHLMTTVVYLATWTKQNIHGRTVCCCILALFMMNIFLGNAHVFSLLQASEQDWTGTTLCVLNGIGGQYFMISAFTWLLVVNFDLWWTFRSLRVDRKQKLKRFLIYSGLGWGFPLLYTGVSIILNFTFKCATSRFPTPDYGVKYCFVSRYSQGFYIYYILSVLISTSFVFSGTTLANLIKSKLDGSNLKSNKKNEDHLMTVLIFLKLGVVMGLTWVFEVISWATAKEDEDSHIIWKIFDLYNALSAVLIFACFVCKRSTLELLEKAHPNVTSSIRRRTTLSS